MGIRFCMRCEVGVRVLLFFPQQSMVVQHWLLTFIVQLNRFAAFVKLTWPCTFRSVSGLSLLVSYLFYTRPITVAFEEILKSNSVSLPPLPPQDYCANLVLWVSMYVFESPCHFLFKMSAESCLRLCWICSLVGEDWHLNSTEPSSSQRWYISPLILLFFNFSQHSFVAFSIQVL